MCGDRYRVEATATATTIAVADGLAQTGDLKLWQQVQSVYQLMCDARWDPLFDREDSHGVRSSRQDLIVRLRDWVNDGDQSSELSAAGASTPAASAPDPAESAAA